MTELPDSVFIPLAVAAFAIVIGAFACERTIGQEIHHHQGMSADVDRFYSTWFKPDHPEQTCCDKIDCYPTEVRYRNGGWEAQQRETGNWIHVPPAAVERNRDGPDGRSHVCMQASQVDPTVFCFVLGGGT